MPVVYGGTTLDADGTMTGKRLAALVGLRDLARRVLQSQNEGWPEAHRQDARRQLNWAYDRFTGHYGPINKTTFGETADGTMIRRMPNLVKFREDPDAMLVMSLEEYDEVTGKATKAAIMTKDVVGKTPPITQVKSAEEGLLVSLNQRGAVDLPFIGTLYGKTESRDRRRAGRPDLPRPGIQNLANRRRLSLRQCAGQARRRRTRRPAICPQCQRPAGRATRGRAARRHRRQTRRSVDTGERHPGIRRRAVQGRTVFGPHRPPEKRCRLEPRRRLRRQSVGRRHVRISARHAPTAPGCSTWP